jgi:aryl-phospho-beta-D-glucosidase BglC (GH1 family)
MKTVGICSICLLCILQTFAQGFLKTQGTRIVNEKGGNVLLRGIGLGGWMLQEPYMLQMNGIARQQQDIRAKIEAIIGAEKTQVFYDAWLNNHCRKTDIDSLAAWGFNSVRLPMHYNLFTLPVDKEPQAGRNTWLTKGFALTDSLISWCSAHRMYVILDLHAVPGGQGNDIAIGDRDPSKPSLWQSEANRQKTIALWTKLAERYAGNPWVAGYDLINETNWGFTDTTDRNGLAEKLNAPLRQLLMDITRAIRTVDKKHMLFIEGNGWANNYNGLFPLWDNNMVISFHKYWNYTNQASIQQFLTFREQYQAPVWMGESGENSNTWFQGAIALLEQNNIGWAWWPLKKLGGNNPFQIKVNEGYRQLLNYWHGKAPQPAPEAAYQALMQLANDTRAENTIYHRDVVDAMFRQQHSVTTLPFLPHQLNDQLTVYAVNYDLGRNGYAYYDTDTANLSVSTGKYTAGNRGGEYRNDGVDIEPCNDSTGNGYQVSYTENGEWLQYSINVQKAGAYTIQFRVASPEAAAITILVNNKPVSKNMVLPATGSYQQWKTVSSEKLILQKGDNRLQVLVEKGGFNLNYLRISKV